MLILVYIANARQADFRLMPGEKRAYNVFTEFYEPELTMRLTLAGVGVDISGTADRSTLDTDEGLREVAHRGRAGGTAFGQAIELEIESVETWDEERGFLGSRIRTRLVLPGVLELDLVSTAKRSGNSIIVEVEPVGSGSPTRSVAPFPEQAQVSVGLLEQAPVDPLEVGVKWREQTVDLEGRLSTYEVEVVGREHLALEGISMPVFRAVARIETKTGFFREVPRWYDFGGRCLRQELPLANFSLTVERAMSQERRRGD